MSPNAATVSRLLGVAGLLVLGAAGCGAADGDATGSAPTGEQPTTGAAPTGGDPAEGDALLAVEVRPGDDAQPARHVLGCADGGALPSSTLPAPAAACEDVARLGPDFFTAEPDPDRACTQQYGGPATARVWGSVGGQAVDTGFSLTDGCEISRWNEVAVLLGPSGA